MEQFEPAHEIATPGVTILFNEERVVLHYFNSRIRLFPPEQSQFNHVEFYDDAGELQATQSEELTDNMFELGYPILSLPFVDVETEEWYVRMQTQDFEDELEALGDAGE